MKANNYIIANKIFDSPYWKSTHSYAFDLANEICKTLKIDAESVPAETLVKQVVCGHCKDCRFWNIQSLECTNDIIWLNRDIQTKKTKRSKTFYNISDLKTSLNFGCIRFESKPSV